MSSIKKTEYKLVLYQAGLGSDHMYFDKTLEKIEKMDENSIVYRDKGKSISESFIDMKSFDCEYQYFYNYDKSTNYKGKSALLTINFNNKIANIVETLIKNPGKILHVKTLINKTLEEQKEIEEESKKPDKNRKKVSVGFDTIANQKIKLKYIINKIKNYDINVKIYLVGHSQGGLVNLETAVEMPDQIEKIISISTPYAPVALAGNLLFLYTVLKMFKMDGSIKDQFTEKSLARYEERVRTLISKDYYSNLKKKWNNLSNRPRLMVITGTSGFVTKTAIGVAPAGPVVVPTDFEQRYPFDGVVLTCEQKNIDYDDNVNLISQTVPCLNNKNYLNKICGALILERCKGCDLPSFNSESAVFKTALQAINGNGPMNNGIFEAIEAGIKEENIEPPDKDYSNYFYIYRSQYSHQFISSCDETIATILGYIH